MQFKTPILLIVFNRPDTTEKVFGAIAEVKPSKLFIASDGPRPNNVDDHEKCRQVKSILENVSWDCEVFTLYQTENLGCSQGPITAINWFFSHVESGIILEDDCLPSKDFFPYCAQLLEYYKNDHRIFNICGSNMSDNREDPSGYYFSRFMNMSGWATWKRSANAIDYELASWKASSQSVMQVYHLLRQNFLDSDINWYKYWKNNFDRTVSEKNITWWDWQWVYYQLEHKMLSVIPNKNLVTNIGFNADATHTKDANNPLANIPIQKMEFPLKHPANLKPDFAYEEYAVKWVWCYHKRLPAIFYIKQFIAGILKGSDKAML